MGTATGVTPPSRRRSGRATVLVTRLTKLRPGLGVVTSLLLVVDLLPLKHIHSPICRIEPLEAYEITKSDSGMSFKAAITALDAQSDGEPRVNCSTPVAPHRVKINTPGCLGPL